MKRTHNLGAAWCKANERLMAYSITIFEIAIPIIFVGMSISKWTSIRAVLDQGYSEVCLLKEILSRVLFALTGGIVLSPMIRSENLSDVDEIRIFSLLAIFAVIEVANILILRRIFANRRLRKDT